MLVLTRRRNESIVIGPNVTVRVVAIRKGSVKLAIEAPPEVPIHREELRRRIEASQLGPQPPPADLEPPPVLPTAAA
jgi:carbon storage regulator